MILALNLLYPLMPSAMQILFLETALEHIGPLHDAVPEIVLTIRRLKEK